MRAIQVWRLSLDERASRHSEGVKSIAGRTEQISQHDLEQESKIGMAIAKTRELEAAILQTNTKVETIESETIAQTALLRDIRTHIGTIMNNPVARNLAYAAAGAATTWLATRGH